MLCFLCNKNEGTRVVEVGEGGRVQVCEPCFQNMDPPVVTEEHSEVVDAMTGHRGLS